MGTISDNLYQVHAQINEACAQCGREPDEVKLLCVSKTKPIEDILEAYRQGERHFGESYAAEASQKIPAIKEQGIDDIVWHFIGPVQSNKTKLIARHFDMAESIDRVKIIERLNEQRPEELKPLEILLEVHISHEEQKSGCAIEDLPPLIEAALKAPRLCLRGLMGIATDTPDKALIESEFATLKTLFDRYRECAPRFDIISMGMTHDLKEAIQCGSTEVRVGTAIFGPRVYKKQA